MIEVGKQVTWKSQAAGSWHEKTGTVIALVKAQHDADDFLPEDIPVTHIKYSKPVSIYDRVLVAVPAGKNGQITHYYCPLQSVLEAQGN